MKRLVVDTDPGLDDAHALAVAAKYVPAEELLVTTVAGNTDVATVTDNAAWLLDALAPGASLHRGAAEPLLGIHEHAEHIHGEDGLAGVPRQPSGRIPVQPGHGAEAIVAAYREAGTGLQIVALGPLTNIALALSVEPAIADCEFTAMGASPAGWGNASINAEYNIYADPAAAEMVFSRMRRTTLSTWDLTLQNRFTSAEITQMFTSGTPAAERIGAIEKHRRSQDPGYASRVDFGRADGLAMAIAMNPDCIAAAARHSVVVGQEGLARGLTSVDWQNHDQTRPHLCIITEINHSAALETLTL